MQVARKIEEKSRLLLYGGDHRFFSCTRHHPSGIESRTKFCIREPVVRGLVLQHRLNPIFIRGASVPRFPFGGNHSLTKVTPIRPLRPRGLRFYPWMSRIPAVLRRFEGSMRLTVDGPAEKIFRCSLFKERRIVASTAYSMPKRRSDVNKKNFGGDVRNRTAPQRRSPIGFNRRRTVHPQKVTSTVEPFALSGDGPSPAFVEDFERRANVIPPPIHALDSHWWTRGDSHSRLARAGSPESVLTTIFPSLHSARPWLTANQSITTASGNDLYRQLCA